MKADAIGLLMWIDTVIYGFVDYVYDIFNALAKVELFKASDYQSIVRNIYAVLGIIMLFVLAYSLLKAVINPDEFAKGETSFPKLIKNVVISLAIIAVLPTVFTVAFNFQNSILNKGTIPKLIFGTGTNYDNENAGSEMSYYVFSAFLHPDFAWCEKENYSATDGDNGDVNLSTCADNIKADGDLGSTNGPTLKAVSESILAGDENYNIFDFKYGESVADGKATYNIFISTVAGVFLLYVLVNFCFDMAVRVVKLMFFQIIAPIPVICRVIPGGKLKDVFSDWMKKTISTYIDVFIRIATMYLGVFMISLVNDNFSDINFGSLGLSQKLIAKALIIMGVVIFIRQAPKLISDMFHLDSGGMKLGLMDKLAMGGALTAGAVAGGAFGMLGRNAVSAVKNFNEAKGKGFKERAKALGFGAASIGAGTLSGAVRGFNRGKGAKNLADMRKASGGAVTAATAAKTKRDAYRANYKNTHPGEGAAQGFLGIGASHILDTAEGVGEYFGINDGLSALQEEQAVYQEGMGFKKELFDLVSDNERVLAYQGMKKSAQEKDIDAYVSDIEKGIRASGFSGRDNTGYFKTNSITGQKEYYKDSTGNILNDLTGMALEQKTADIKKYDDAIKLASLSAISEKINKGDGRFTAVLKKSEVWKSQHADNSTVSSMMSLENLDSSQISAISTALSSNDASRIKQVLDAFEGDAAAMSALGISSLGIMANDKNLKKANGAVQEAIAEKIQEKKKESK